MLHVSPRIRQARFEGESRTEIDKTSTCTVPSCPTFLPPDFLHFGTRILSPVGSALDVEVLIRGQI